MKHTFFVILLCGIVLVSSYAQSSISDLYKQWMIEDINKGRFDRAAEEITHIDNWFFDPYDKNTYIEFSDAFTFAAYADSIGVAKSMIDSLYLYVDQECLFFLYHFYSSGNYENAVPYGEMSVVLRKSVLGENHPNCASSLNNLAELYRKIDDYSRAEQYYLESLKICKVAFGENHPDYATCINNLGSLYQDMGEYSKAEQYYLESLKIIKEILGENHTNYAGVLNNLGSLYNSMGDYSHAEQCYLESMNIHKSLLGESHSKYAASLNNLGRLYNSKGEYSKAEQYFLESLKIIKSVLGENHPDYAVSLNNLGSLYHDMGEYSKAEQYFLESLRISKTVLGENHPDCATFLNNLGGLYNSKGEYSKAEQYFLESLKIIKSVLGENHPDYAVSLNNLGGLYNNMGDYSKAEKPFLQCRQIYTNSFIQSTNFMSEKQRNLYWHSIQSVFTYSYPLFAYHYYNTKPSIATFAYNNELFAKGLLLSSSNAIKRSIIDSGDTDLISRWNELTTKKQQIMALEEKEPQSAYLTQIREEAEQLEKEITRSSAAYRENMRQWNISWDSVKAALKPNQVAIEYMRAPLNKDSTMYCALLLRDTCSYPIMIPLFEEKEVAALLNTSNGDTAQINSTYIYNKNGKLLSQHIWNKVKAYIKEGEDIYFSPTGILHQIAIENLPYDENHTMGEIYNIQRLSSTRDLVLHKQSISPTSAALFGGINYDATPEDLYTNRVKPIEDEEDKQTDNTLIADNAKRDSKGPLPGTKIEVREIDKVLTEANVHVQRDTAEIATEEAFMALSGKHKHIIHLATHGFYWQDSTAQNEKYFTQRAIAMDNTNVPMSIDPLERCGLLFAGANTALKGKGKRLEEYGVQDGVLTAKEISTMDLRDAELVVLSACETGLGDITGDGVFGLQRAFKMAGAKTIIMSLWKVDDNATQLLMSEFYKNWVTSKGKLSKREAFRKAQNAVRLQYSNPVYWAGFIILD